MRRSQIGAKRGRSFGGKLATRGEFLLLQKHDGEQPIGTYPVSLGLVQAGKARGRVGISVVGVDRKIRSRVARVWDP